MKSRLYLHFYDLIARESSVFLRSKHFPQINFAPKSQKRGSTAGFECDTQLTLFSHEKRRSFEMLEKLLRKFIVEKFRDNSVSNSWYFDREKLKSFTETIFSIIKILKNSQNNNRFCIFFTFQIVRNAILTVFQNSEKSTVFALF